jgi:hypothetical protein
LDPHAAAAPTRWSGDGSRGVTARAALGAELPGLLGLGVGLAAGGALLLALGGLVLVLAVRGRRTGS